MIRAQEEPCLFGAVYGDDCTKQVDLLSSLMLRQLFQSIWKHCHVVRQVVFAKWDLDGFTYVAGNSTCDHIKAENDQSCKKIHVV